MTRTGFEHQPLGPQEDRQPHQTNGYTSDEIKLQLDKKAHSNFVQYQVQFQFRYVLRVCFCIKTIRPLNKLVNEKITVGSIK